MIINYPLLEYQCPFCKNPYWGSEIVSYSIYDSTSYSDGTKIGTYGIPLHGHVWITKCPKCGKFFEKKYLEDCRIPEVDFNDILDYASFRYDLSKEDKKFIEKYLLSPDRNLIKNSADRHQNTLIFLVRRFLREYKKYMLDCDLRRKDQCYGRIDGIGPAYDSESGNQGLFFARFWKDAITTGLSFPTEPAKEERESLQKQMILNLWQAYHRPLIVYSNCLPNIDEIARKHETDTWFGIDSLKSDIPEMEYLPQIDTKNYLLFCIEILAYFQTDEDKDLLVLAELYRNLSEFDLSVRTLKKIQHVEKYSCFIDKIHLAAKQGITKTVQISPIY